MSTDVFPRIPVAGPWVTDCEVRFVAEAAANDWYQNAGRSVDLFEREFAEYLGVEYAAAVPHGSSALHLAMLALGVGPGDEVVVPESTWVASAAPIVYAGATPVFADIDPNSWCVSADSISRCLTPRTKAIVTVDLYGNVPDVRAITEVAQDVPIVEDAAQALGASSDGVPAGRHGDIAIFSFHGTKTMTTGEGGMVVTDSAALFERVTALRDHGRNRLNRRDFTTDEIGYKYRMSSLQAAFGRAQLLRIDELVGRKKQIFGWYEDRLSSIPGVQLNERRPGVDNTFWMATAVVDRSYRLSTARMMERFDAGGIDTRPFLPPLSSLGALADFGRTVDWRTRNPVSYDIATRSINLPSALSLEESHVDRIFARFNEMLLEGGAIS